MPTRLFFSKRRGWDLRGHCARALRRASTAVAQPRTRSRACLASVPVCIVERARRTSRARGPGEGLARKKAERPFRVSRAFRLSRSHRAARASCARHASAGVRRRGHRALEAPRALAQRQRVLRLRRARARGGEAGVHPDVLLERIPDCLDADAANECRSRRELELSILLRGPERGELISPCACVGSQARARARVPAEPPSRDISPTRALLS